MDALRVVKYRSVEGGPFTKNYNRLRFQMPADKMATDFSKSYIAFEVALIDSDGALIDVSLYKDGKQQIVFCDGNGRAYPSSCLVRNVRLSNMAGSKTYEEIQFSNVLSTTLWQLCNSVTSVASSTSGSGTAVVFDEKSSIMASVGQFVKNPSEVHVPLSALFEMGKLQEVHLDELGGLLLEIELEPQHQLFQAVKLPQTLAVPKTIVSEGQAGWTPEVSASAVPCVSDGQQRQDLGSGVGLPTFGQANFASGFMFPADTYVKSFLDADPAISSDIIEMADAYHWTAQDFTDMKIAVGKLVKLHFVCSSATGTRKVAIERVCSITAVTPWEDGVTNAEITLSEAYKIPALTYELVEFGGFEVLAGTTITIVEVTQAGNFTSLKDAKQIVLSGAEETAFVNAGLLTAGFVPDTKLEFSMDITFSRGDDLVFPVRNVSAVVGGVNTISAMQSLTLPVGTNHSGMRLVAYDHATLTATFAKSGLASEEGVPYAERYDVAFNTVNATGVTAEADHAQLYIYGIKNTAVPITGSIDYSISRAELVLVQSAKRTMASMPKEYKTYKLESFVIDTPQKMYNRQFICEPNVFNAWLLTPQMYASGEAPTVGQSLISWGRNVGAFRWAVNNVDDTNRDIDVRVPSSLYYDKLIDTFTNTDARLRSLMGVLSLQDTEVPVKMFPLRIYKGYSTDGLKMDGVSKTLQVELSNADSEIVSGNCFLFKEIVKQL